MRSLVWCVVLVLAACGKSERSSDAERRGSAGGISSVVGGGNTAAASGTGTAGTSSGGAETNGGTPSGGTAGTADSSVASGSEAGRGSARGGQGSGGLEAGAGNGMAGSSASAGDGGAATAGEAGNAGAAGAASLECGGEYDACGCGCCGGTAPSTVCYYPDRGESLESIKRDDQSTALSPSCAGAGCSLGRHYVCCANPSEPATGTSYSTTGGMVSADVYRVSLYRTGADARCQVAHLARGDGPGGKEFPIALPSGWILEVLEDYACADVNSQIPSKRRDAVGGIGSLDFAGAGGDCTLKFDFTLFFQASDGDVDAVRFVSDAETAPVVPECG